MTTLDSSLHARNISRLPWKLRTAASAAMNGSTEAIAQLQRAANNLTQSESPGLLPVIYTTLDPSLIPSPDVLDTMTTASSRPSSVVRAVLAVSCLAVVAHDPHLSSTAMVELWPRVHAWMEFFSDSESVLALSPAERTSWEMSLSQALMGFWNCPETYKVVESTNGVRRVLASAWTALMQVPVPNIHNVLAGGSSPLLALDEIQNEEHIAELIEGCGGNVKSLLDTVTKTISLATTSASPYIASMVITPVLTLLAQIKVVAPDISQQFIAKGVIPFLISALAIEGNPPLDSHRNRLPDLPVGIHMAPSILMSYLGLMPSYKWTLRAVHAGLLERIIAWGEKLGPAAPDAGVFPHMLRVVLPRVLRFPSAIAELKTALSRVDTASRSTAFTQSVLYPSWMAFKNIVDSRMLLVETWQMDRAHATLACDNLQCERVDKRHCFRRCSGCSFAAYCSQTCQRSDWVEGHRSECRVLTSSALLGKFRDSSFLRALLHSTYNTRRLDIALKIIEFMVVQPNTLFLVTYDYTPRIETETSVVIEVQPLTNLNEPLR
ncbi:hypothetical protein FB45DRAFT_934374 [Roridomyces roridus]|uniref:MYND-type domain-containing protein n=1 Tax=Roridomyces roridus TaxID=1738132 RepID=A0AAD7BC40_9AGAR|nr:hypothetical protein FB45DRAFT_934374 [Roridomyces roridus]